MFERHHTPPATMRDRERDDARSGIRPPSPGPARFTLRVTLSGTDAHDAHVGDGPQVERVERAV